MQLVELNSVFLIKIVYHINDDMLLIGCKNKKMVKYTLFYKKIDDNNCLG